MRRDSAASGTFLAAAMLPEDSARFADIYCLLLGAARAEGILIRQYHGRPPLLDTLLLPADAERPRRRYRDWHRELAA